MLRLRVDYRIRDYGVSKGNSNDMEATIDIGLCRDYSRNLHELNRGYPKDPRITTSVLCTTQVPLMRGNLQICRLPKMYGHPPVTHSTPVMGPDLLSGDGPLRQHLNPKSPYLRSNL